MNVTVGIPDHHLLDRICPGTHLFYFHFLVPLTFSQASTSLTPRSSSRSRWCCLPSTYRRLSTTAETLSSPPRNTRMGRSGAYFYLLGNILVALTTLCSHPKTFACSIKPRSAKAEALIRAVG